jgi:hypothetical protein
MRDDDESELGDTKDVHDGIIPEDLPRDHPGRPEAERQARESPDGVARGNVGSPLPERAREALDADDDPVEPDH